jgi:peptidoglycan-associated lipoprotein
MKRSLRLKLALLLVVPGLLFGASCAKKTVKSDAAISEEQAAEAAKEAAKKAAEKAAKDRETQEERRRFLEEERIKQAEKSARAQFENEDIYFEYDKSSLLPEAQERLKRKAEYLENNPGISVIIEGHCDERGTNEYNIALGDRRAKSARNFLINLGIAGSRLETISYGEEQPLDPGHNEAAWAKNRRAHFVIR